MTNQQRFFALAVIAVALLLDVLVNGVHLSSVLAMWGVALTAAAFTVRDEETA